MNESVSAFGAFSALVCGAANRGGNAALLAIDLDWPPRGGVGGRVDVSLDPLWGPIRTLAGDTNYFCLPPLLRTPVRFRSVQSHYVSKKI